MKYLDPKADLTFKRVFGEHKHLLISFLNALLPLEDDEQIVSVEYLSPEMIPDTPTKKDSIVDVRCIDQRGRQFIVEMQLYWTSAFKRRALLNTCKAYSGQVKPGDKFSRIRPVYTLSIVDDIAFPNETRFYHRYQLIDVQNSANRIDGFEMIFVELPKFAQWQSTEGKNAWNEAADNKVVISDISFKKLAILWLRYLTEVGESTIEADADLLANDDVNEAVGLLRDGAYNDGQRLAYDRYWDMVSRERTALDEREDIGRVKGEKMKAWKIARAMKATGIMTIEQISEITELTIEELASQLD